MKKLVCWSLVFCAFAPMAATAGRVIALLPAGDMPAALAERARAFAQENLALPVVLESPVSWPSGPDSLRGVGEALAGQKKPEHACLVVLAYPPEELSHHGVLLEDLGMAVINVKALEPKEPDEEQFGRRVEREVMMSIGLLLGLDACPNPECAMWRYSNLEELDAKGRNYCPPCLIQVQKRALEQGIEIIADSPFALYPEPAAPPAAEAE